MSRPGDDRPGLTSLSGPLREALRRLGLADMDVLWRIMADWDELAGPPWAGASSPVFLRAGELTVEAAALGAVRVLRYATGDLMEKLDEFCGPGVVQTIRVVGPG